MSIIEGSAPAGRRKASDVVADRIREKIVSGRLKPGDRLPNEHALGAKFAVGRSSVREALRTLATEGLVVSQRGAVGGTFVGTPPPGRLVEFLTGSFSLLAAANEVTVSELLEVRELLEVPATGTAALRRDEAQLDRLQANLDGLHAADLTHMYQANRGFHETLLEASGSRLLCMLAEPIFITLGTRFIRDRATMAFWEQVIADHGRILDAVRKGDAKGAGSAMAEHLHNLRATYELIDASRGDRDAEAHGEAMI